MDRSNKGAKMEGRAKAAPGNAENYMDCIVKDRFCGSLKTEKLPAYSSGNDAKNLKEKGRDKVMESKPKSRMKDY